MKVSYGKNSKLNKAINELLSGNQFFILITDFSNAKLLALVFRQISQSKCNLVCQVTRHSVLLVTCVRRSY